LSACIVGIRTLNLFLTRSCTPKASQTKRHQSQRRCFIAATGISSPRSPSPRLIHPAQPSDRQVPLPKQAPEMQGGSLRWSAPNNYWPKPIKIEVSFGRDGRLRAAQHQVRPKLSSISAATSQARRQHIAINRLAGFAVRGVLFTEQKSRRHPCSGCEALPWKRTKPFSASEVHAKPLEFPNPKAPVLPAQALWQV
jgi:hypothetical protein